MAKNTNFLFKLDLLILSVLKRKDCYGYEMTKIISEKTGGIIVPKYGTMYPVLYELMKQGYISSYNIVVDNKNRVYYHLEDKGEQFLKLLVNDYDMLVSAINKVVH